MAPQRLEKIESRGGNGMGSDASHLQHLVPGAGLMRSLEFQSCAGRGAQQKWGRLSGIAFEMVRFVSRRPVPEPAARGSAFAPAFRAGLLEPGFDRAAAALPQAVEELAAEIGGALVF